MTAEIKDPLAKYRRPGQDPVHAIAPAPGAAAVSAEKPAYEAFKVGKDVQRHLEIRLKFPDPAECPINAMITNIRVEWRWGMAVTIIYGTALMVNIKGERLQPLFEALKDWKAVWIAEFDPANHSAPVDADAPLIKSIEIVTERPEPLPPMNARH